MNILKKAVIAGGCATLLALGSGNVMAQGRGNFDPQQMMQQRLDSLRDQMEVKDDQEWSAISPKITKVMEAQRDLMSGRMRAMFRGGGRRNRGGTNGNADDNAGGQQRRRGGFGGEPSAAMDALQKAVDDKAPSSELKTKLAAVQAEWKDKQAKMLAAEEDLRGVLSPRQEAIATLNGLLQ